MQIYTQGHKTAIKAAKKSEFQHPPGFLNLEDNKANLKRSRVAETRGKNNKRAHSSEPTARLGLTSWNHHSHHSWKWRVWSREAATISHRVQQLSYHLPLVFYLEEQQWQCPLMTLTCGSVWRRRERSRWGRGLFFSRALICIPEHLIIVGGFEMCVVWLWWNRGDQGCRREGHFHRNSTRYEYVSEPQMNVFILGCV